MNLVINIANIMQPLIHISNFTTYQILLFTYSEHYMMLTVLHALFLSSFSKLTHRQSVLKKVPGLVKVGPWLRGVFKYECNQLHNFFTYMLRQNVIRF